MREQIIRIKTYDTEETYEYPAKGKSNPQVWQATITLSHVDLNGRPMKHHGEEKSIYLERETLENAGLLPKRMENGKKVEQNEKSPEDLILQLLELVGVYPTEG